MSTKPVEAVLLGAGGRGLGTFGHYALQNPDKLRFVVVAEPDDARRTLFASQHAIAPDQTFKTWQELLERPQLAPAMVNATMDRLHAESTLPALQKGYHVLLEKPMAVDAGDCIRLVRKARSTRRVLQLGHTLRYSPFFTTLKQLLDEGRIGRLLHVDHAEQVAYWHMAHSFVRGKWANESRSGPMILTKCCHDLDLLTWMIGEPALRIASFGALTHFRSESVGPEIPHRCTDGCPIEPDCPYSAIRQYLGRDTGWPVSSVSLDSSAQARREAILTGPYGRCVYRCDNDVVDHQTLTIEFAGDVTVGMTMQGHAHENTRTMRYSGTEGEIRGHAEKRELIVYHFATGQEERIATGLAPGGHGGGDPRLCEAFVEAVRDDDPSQVLASGEAGLEGHLLCFAADQARKEHRAIDMQKFRQEAEALADRQERA